MWIPYGWEEHFLAGDFFWKIFSKVPKILKSLFRVFQKILRGSKKDFFPNFYDSFSITTQVVFLREKKGTQKSKK
jgi:hypothetical protein